MGDIIEYINHNYRTIAENETIDKTEFLCMLEDIYNIGFEDGNSEGYDYGYNDCLEENGIDG